MNTLKKDTQYWIVDPKYILDKTAENIFANTLKASYIEGKVLNTTLQLTPEINSEVLIFRPFAGAQMYIISKNGLYDTSLPCDSTFLMILPKVTALQLPKFDEAVGFTLIPKEELIPVVEGTLIVPPYKIVTFETN